MILEEFKLEGKVALLAGDNPLGPGLASALAEAGADLALVGGDAGVLETEAAEVRRWGRKAVLVPADLARGRAVAAAVKKALSQLGPIDILVTNTAQGFAKPLGTVTEREWNRVLEANLKSVFLLTREVSRTMLERRKGRVVIIASALSVRGLPNSAVYCASMAALHGLTDALALEWAQVGIRINLVGPGWFQAPGQEPPPEQVLRWIPLRRAGKPEDLGALVVYLASDSCDYMTGKAIFVDGGVLCRI